MIAYIKFQCFSSYAKKCYKTFMHTVLKKYGCNLCVSSHEIHGLLHEEMSELEDSVQGNNVYEIRGELLDVAITAIWGLASIKHIDIITAGWGKKDGGIQTTEK